MCSVDVFVYAYRVVVLPVLPVLPVLTVLPVLIPSDTPNDHKPWKHFFHVG